MTDNKNILAEVHQSASAESIDRKKRGYSDLGEISIYCGNCNEELAIIKVVKDTKEEHKFKAECSSCGGESFIKKVCGKVYIDAAPHLKIDDIVYGDISIIKVK